MGGPKQRWTFEEDVALRAGVAKHGVGNWRMILRDPKFSSILRYRSNVDLKDKWRNINVLFTASGSHEKGRTAMKTNKSAPKNTDHQIANSTVASDVDDKIVEEKPIAMAEVNSYEEQRRRQVEENKRKLEELRLHNLSATVRQAAAKPMPRRRQVGENKRKLVIPRSPDALIRRSGRIASLPEQPDYRIANTHRNEHRVPVYATKEQRAYAITKAEELMDQLGSDHPTFIKPMSHSYATKAYQLIIPMHFRQYLPLHDEMMVLMDEMNNEFDVFYSYKQHHKVRLTPWKGFATEHKLADGDCLVFQLIERRKFKVYIARASSYNKNDH